MDNKTIIEVNNISKDYLVSTANVFSFRKRIKVSALKNLNFKIQEKDRVGIIGRNGSGKSTLCKIISGITYPTEGEIKIRGKISSVLEAGTGFDPELSGYENIIIGGAVLGMNRKSIMNKIENIIKFSEIGEHINMPLKKYSTGMNIKLAFAVASFLDGNVFILDEILAVADEKFRKKCIKKILDDCINFNKTLLLVSHDIRNILGTCNKIIYLKKGEIIAYGEAEKIAKIYQEEES
tara:strand:+ start:653 stop:1363 length:711 start_codon:yes stop_codon:yes gene_type:complete